MREEVLVYASRLRVTNRKYRNKKKFAEMWKKVLDKLKVVRYTKKVVCEHMMITNQKKFEKK